MSCHVAVSWRAKKRRGRSNVKLWKLVFNSSRKNWTSSMISSSDHFRVHKFLANGRSWATSIAGRLSRGALTTRFCTSWMRVHRRRWRHRTHPERRDDDPNNFLFDCALCNVNKKWYDVVFPDKINMGWQETYQDLLVDVLGHVLLKREQPDTESNLIAHLGARLVLQDLDEPGL